MSQCLKQREYITSETIGLVIDGGPTAHRVAPDELGSPTTLDEPPISRVARVKRKKKRNARICVLGRVQTIDRNDDDAADNNGRVVSCTDSVRSQPASRGDRRSSPCRGRINRRPISQRRTARRQLIARTRLVPFSTFARSKNEEIRGRSLPFRPTNSGRVSRCTSTTVGHPASPVSSHRRTRTIVSFADTVLSGGRIVIIVELFRRDIRRAVPVVRLPSRRRSSSLPFAAIVVME